MSDADKIFVTSLKEFFDAWVPRFKQHPSAAEAKGTIAFDLTGSGGGVWRLTFPATTVSTGEGPADLRWGAEAQDFLNYLNGQVARWELEDAGRPFRWEGDRDLMHHFRTILDTLRRSKGRRPV